MGWMAHLSLEHHEACTRAGTLLDKWQGRAAETELARCISQQTMDELCWPRG